MNLLADERGAVAVIAALASLGQLVHAPPQQLEVEPGNFPYGESHPLGFVAGFAVPAELVVVADIVSCPPCGRGEAPGKVNCAR